MALSSFTKKYLAVRPDLYERVKERTPYREGQLVSRALWYAEIVPPNVSVREYKSRHQEQD